MKDIDRVMNSPSVFGADSKKMAETLSETEKVNFWVIFYGSTNYRDNLVAVNKPSISSVIYNHHLLQFITNSKRNGERGKQSSIHHSVRYTSRLPIPTNSNPDPAGVSSSLSPPSSSSRIASMSLDLRGCPASISQCIRTVPTSPSLFLFPPCPSL